MRLLQIEPLQGVQPQRGGSTAAHLIRFALTTAHQVGDNSGVLQLQLKHHRCITPIQCSNGHLALIMLLIYSCRIVHGCLLSCQARGTLLAAKWAFLAAACAAAAQPKRDDSRSPRDGVPISAAVQPTIPRAKSLGAVTAAAVLGVAAQEADSAQPAALLDLLECVR